MSDGAFLRKSSCLPPLVLAGALALQASCGDTAEGRAEAEDYDAAVFVPGLPAELADDAVQRIAREMAPPSRELVELLASRGGIEADARAALLARVEVRREHPYTAKPDRDALGRHRLGWRIRAKPRDAAERAFLDDLRAAIELEVWAAAVGLLSPQLEIRASALEGPRGVVAPRRRGERAALALDRLAWRGIATDRWERVRRWCREE
jgi:hypothetical protein